MHNLRTNFSITPHYMLAVRLAKVSRIRAIDPLHVNLTEMTMVVHECFNTVWSKFSSLDLCLGTTMKMYVLLDVTDDDVNVFDCSMLTETLKSCLNAVARSVLLPDSKVLAFSLMICAKVLALLYDNSKLCQEYTLLDGFENICNDHFQLLCQRLAQKRSDDTHREPFLEYMVRLFHICNCLL